MAIIKNEDLNIMIKVEHLIMSENRVDLMRELDTNGKCYYGDELITTNDINLYWNMVERFCQHKDLSRQKAREFNRTNAEYHRLYNNYWTSKKRGNTKQAKYWKTQLDNYKRNEVE